MSEVDEFIPRAFRLNPRHVQKLADDAAELARLMGTAPNQNAVIRAAIEQFDAAAWVRRQVERAAETRAA